ncbi:MAG: metallophosphoesterase [Caloramator sp.]|nr:metallophosphoesterase [Caloramator sp.]
MALYAIGDLHLSFAVEKPMDVFGEIWSNHYKKIEYNWNKVVKDEDVVLIPGDISWGMKLSEALPDLDYVHKLKGKKILIKGNHDYWWSSITKLNSLYEDMCFIQNTYAAYQDYGICGSRGWVSINGEEKDEKIYKRELLRLKLSLDCAIKSGYKKLIVMMHYPPITKISKSMEFLELLSNYPVEKLIYGHVHNDSKDICINGIYKNIEYICTSCDIINFNPVRIL